MKYKCTAKCFVEDAVIMHPGDIVVMEGNQFYNITTGVDYRDVPDKEHLKSCLVALTDEPAAVLNVPKSAIPSKLLIPLTDADRFRSVTDKMLAIFKQKNHDYGNSFEQSLFEEGLAAARIRMGDKWNRFKQLSKGEEALVKDESLRDTLIDMANYAIMTVMWMDKQQRCGSDGR